MPATFACWATIAEEALDWLATASVPPPWLAPPGPPGPKPGDVPAGGAPVPGPAKPAGGGPAASPAGAPAPEPAGSAPELWPGVSWLRPRGRPAPGRRRSPPGGPPPAAW